MRRSSAAILATGVLAVGLLASAVTPSAYATSAQANPASGPAPGSALTIPPPPLDKSPGAASAKPAAANPMSMDAAKVGTLPDAPPGSVVLRGLAGQSETLDAAQIAKLPHEQVSVTRDGKTVVWSGPGLDDLLRDVDVPLGNRIHGQGVNDVIFVTGRDRYRTVLTLPEIDPSFHKGARVILADQADGKPLNAHDGPYRLIIDGDLHPSRSVFGVVLIEVKHLP